MSRATVPQEKRRFERVSAQHMVSFAHLVSGAPIEPVSRLGRTLDLGAGGIRLETDSALRVGDQLLLEIAVGSQIVHAEATVVHLPPTASDLIAAGIAFDRVPDDDRETLTALGYAA